MPFLMGIYFLLRALKPKTKIQEEDFGLTASLSHSYRPGATRFTVPEECVRHAAGNNIKV